MSSRHKNLIAVLFSLSFLSLLGARLAQADQILLEDHFNRPDSASLGAPWTEQNEVTSEFTSPNGDLIGPGFIELNNGTLGFHYTTHSQRFQNFFHSGHGNPSTFAPLSSPVTSFPVTLSYTFAPHEDERTSVFVGLMSSGHGFSNIGSGIEPNFGLAINVSRSSFAFNNSTMNVFKYDNGNRIHVGSTSLPFQLEFGIVYSVQFTIAQDFSTTLQVSDGTSTSSVSTGPTSFTVPISVDQMFLSSVDGGVSFDTLALGDFITRFDDVLVTQAGLTIQIDIKPGSFPNSINPRSKGNIPVAILTTDATNNTVILDATTVDPTTVHFGRTGTEAAPVQDALEDVDGDGDTDMILHFNTQDTGIQCGDTSATLTGVTFGGQAITGTDSIKTAGCK